MLTTASRFHCQSTPIAGVVVIERRPIHDQRGFFERVFCANELIEFTHGKPIVQINHTFTTQCGTVRGLHFQYPPAAEIKFVTCVRGELFDVAVDIRADSPTFLHWHGEYLSADNYKMLIIPEGFAHGFQALSDDCELLYMNTAYYTPELESGFNPTDKAFEIRWPQTITDLSPRDAVHTPLDSQFLGIQL